MIATIGIEYHRQLSANKLMCSCMAKTKYEENEIVKVAHHKTKTIHQYRYNCANSCDYELDEKPPVLNQRIVQKAVDIAKRFPGITIVDKLIFMRKQILDGSIVGGYQRTALLAYGGYIDIGSKRVAIKGLYLEEDSCTKYQGVYSVNRAGVPLLEVVTEKAQLSGKEVVMLLREIENLVNEKKNLPKGVNVIRQDINISLPNHPKVEIKGVDKLSLVEPLIAAQIKRQKMFPETCTSTRKYSSNSEYLSEHMRTSLGSNRMSYESEVPLTPVSVSSKRKKITLDQKWANLCRNQHQLRLAMKAEPADFYCFSLCVREKTRKACKLFSSYLKDFYSLVAIKNRTYESPLSTQEADSLIDNVKSDEDKIQLLRSHASKLNRSTLRKIRSLTFN